MRPQTGRTSIRSLAACLGERMEAGTLPRNLRAEARRLAMAAWLAQSKPSRSSSERVARDAIARRIDDLLVRADRAGRPAPPPLAAARRIGPRFLASILDGPIVTRLDAIEAAVAALAMRTRRMVEHARAVAGETSGTKQAAPAEDAGREEGFELVWGHPSECPKQSRGLT